MCDKLDIGSSITTILLFEAFSAVDSPLHNSIKYRKLITIFSPSLNVLKTSSSKFSRFSLYNASSSEYFSIVKSVMPISISPFFIFSTASSIFTVFFRFSSISAVLVLISDVFVCNSFWTFSTDCS